jgi:S1-C subfamily serine protease
VIVDSPAEKAGVRTGDIVTEIDNKNLTDNDIVLATYVNKKKIGESVILKIWRNEQEMSITVVLEKKN